MRKNVVVIGGGTGLSSVLSGLKNEDIALSAIVTIADNGGSTGKLKESYHIPAVGDLRNVLTSLFKDEYTELIKLASYRFDNNRSELNGHSLGNLILAALYDMHNHDLQKAVDIFSLIFEVKAHVIPSSNDVLELTARMDDGTLIRGESQITKYPERIKEVYYDTNDLPKANKHAVEALQEADVIILGPGSLYTSILPNLLFPEIKEALKHSKAEKILISNIMTEKGETDGFTTKNIVDIVHEHVGYPIIQTLIYNSKEIPKGLREAYLSGGSNEIIFESSPEILKEIPASLLFVEDETKLRHHSEELSNVLMKCIYDTN